MANEVKNLAGQTARATEEISQKIQTIQENTEASVAAIEEITKVISQNNDYSNSIASAVEEQSATTQEMTQIITNGLQASVDQFTV